MNNSTQVAPWGGSAGIIIPPNVERPQDLVPYASTLSVAEQQRVIQALQSGFFEMGAEFVWRRAMTRLRTTISGLGMSFISEMLDRSDISPTASAESVLTDFETIQLSESLGIVNATGALRLRHAFELLAHFAQGATDEEISQQEAISVIRACAQYALGEETPGIAVNFSEFRNRLLQETVSAKDPQIEQFVEQPPFFLRTALRILLSAIRTDQGGRLQHALSNLNILLPLIWSRLPEPDRWAVGELYTEASASGNSSIVLDLKRALQSVRGFDYVPENLRSNTFRKAAQSLVSVHFSFGNYAAEVPAVQQLASLGTIIPKPAVADCVRAYLCVYLGNHWGHSFAAAPIAYTELQRLAPASWDYYFGEVLKTDEVILQKLLDEKPRSRFQNLIDAVTFQSEEKLPPKVTRLVRAARKKNSSAVSAAANVLLADYK